MARMIAALAAGYIRLAVRFSPGPVPNPGELASASGVSLDDLGPLWIEGREARIDVKAGSVDKALSALSWFGQVDIVEMRWRWLKLMLGRNHGFTLGRMKKLLAECDAGPLGTFNLNNTHTMIGILDHRAERIVEGLSRSRINGAPVRFELLPFGTGQGDPAFVPGG